MPSNAVARSKRANFMLLLLLLLLLLLGLHKNRLARRPRCIRRFASQSTLNAESQEPVNRICVDALPMLRCHIYQGDA